MRSIVKSSKRIELQHHLDRFAPDVVLLTETWLTGYFQVKLRGYKIFRNDRTDALGGGTAIAIKNVIAHENVVPRTAVTSFEFSGLIVKLANGSRIAMLTVYRSRKPLIPNELSQLIAEIKAVSSKLIVGGDFNAWNTNWACDSTNSEGRKLQDVADQANLDIIRTRSPSRFSSSGTASFIDLFLVERNLRILGDRHLPTVPFESDHECVILRMGLISPVDALTEETFLNWPDANMDRIRFETFQFVKDNPVPKHYSMTRHEIDMYIEHLTLHLTNSIEKYVPRKLRRGATFSQLDAITSKLILERRKLRKIQSTLQKRVHLHGQHPSILVPSKAAINRLTPLIDKNVSRCRAEAFRKKCAGTRNGASLFQNIRMMSGYKRRVPVSTDITTGQSILTSNKDRSNAFVKHYKAVHEEAEQRGDPTFNDEVDTRVREEFDFVNRLLEFSITNPACIDETAHDEDVLVDTAVVMSYVKNLNNKRSFGHDGIPNWILRKLPVEFFKELATLFNQCICRGYFPSYWKLATIVPLLKPGKNVKRIVSYRPVSMLSNLSKLLERVLKRTIDNHLDEKRILPPNQFGFRARTSTEDALFVLQSITINALNQRQTLFGLAIDTEKAFDAVWKEGLISKMCAYGFDLHIVRMIYSFLTDRHISVQIEGVRSEWHAIRTGVPQGAVLSPVLYNLYVADLPAPDALETQSIQFADDQFLLAYGDDTEAAVENLEEYANDIVAFCKRWKIKINPAKSQFIKIYGRKCKQSHRTRRITKNARIFVDNTEVEAVSSLKYLGININDRYDFSQHAQLMAKRGLNAYGAVNHLFKTRALDISVKRTLYKTLVRPTMLYAFSSWSSISSAQMENLRVTERKIIRKVHLSHGRKRETHHFINNQQLYNDTEISRIDRVGFMGACRFLRRARASPNSLVRHHIEDQLQKAREATIHTLYASPASPLHELNNNTAFDGAGNLLYFHRSARRGHGQVYNTLQNNLRGPDGDPA